MATLSEIRDIVIENIQDPTVTNASIDKKINDGNKYCSSKVLFEDNDTVSSFDTDSTSGVVLPSAWNFSRNLYRAAVLDKPGIQVLNSIALLKRKYPNYDTEIVEGDIEFIAIRKGILNYFPVPSDVVTVQCSFYSKVSLLVADDDEPSALPDDLAESLLANYASWKLYALIEDGMEGAKVNTRYYKNEFLELFNELDDETNIGQSRPEPDRDTSWI